jgi:hypothetical protein
MLGRPRPLLQSLSLPVFRRSLAHLPPPPPPQLPPLPLPLVLPQCAEEGEGDVWSSHHHRHSRELAGGACGTGAGMLERVQGALLATVAESIAPAPSSSPEVVVQLCCLSSTPALPLHPGPPACCSLTVCLGPGRPVPAPLLCCLPCRWPTFCRSPPSSAARPTCWWLPPRLERSSKSRRASSAQPRSCATRRKSAGMQVCGIVRYCSWYCSPYCASQRA